MCPTGDGVVYLVGAGPGDPELITVKGKRLLAECDAVLYDNLLPEELVVTLPGRVEKYFVGKKAGRACCSQTEINQLMVRLAREGKRVVRLKGSDPLVFGRGAEEARYLKQEGVRFEIVPGVTAGIAAPAYAGIPCTDREKSSFVLFVTGHKARDKDVSSVPWEWVAQAGDGTLVIYMGVSQISNIVDRLTRAGMPGTRPAAVIERGTCATQRAFRSTLAQLPATVARQNVKAPAIFVIGGVAQLQPLLEWFDGRPLLGVRVMVTRPADQAEDMYARLRELGAEVLPYPTIATEETFHEGEWRRFDTVSSDERWLVFTSENGVRYFMSQFLSRVSDVRTLGSFKIAAVGHGTAEALRRYNLVPDFLPGKATTGALAEELVASRSWAGVTVVRVQGNLSAVTVRESLVKAGADVIPITVYRTFFPTWPEGLKEKLFEYPPDIVTFTSGSSVDGLFEYLSPDEVGLLTRDAILVSIGPMTSQVAGRHGLTVTVEATDYSIPGLIDRLVEHVCRHPVRRSS